VVERQTVCWVCIQDFGEEIFLLLLYHIIPSGSVAKFSGIYSMLHERYRRYKMKRYAMRDGN